MGGAACAECHEAETARWAGSDHDLAMQVASDESVLGDFAGATVELDGDTTTFLRRDGRYVVRTSGANGEPAEFEVAYTFGVRPLQQYLIAFDGGRYQFLGIAWDSRSEADGGQRWFHLYDEGDRGPESPLHWTRPSQTWNTVCAECHSTGLRKGFDPSTGRYGTTWSDLDVSCEACHGPGSRHMEIARAAADAARNDVAGSARRGAEGGPAGAGGGLVRADWGLTNRLGQVERAWIFAPGTPIARRDPSPESHAEVETCAPCHARRATIAQTPRPGADVLDGYSVALLREGLYYADGQIRDEVYVYGSFLQSRMYGAGVTCSDCHDPHGLDLRATGNALCARCHRAEVYEAREHTMHEATSTGSRCVACHMPETTYMGVDARRDHSFRVPRPDLSRTLGVPNACNRCHLDRSAEWAEDALSGREVRDEAQGTYARAVARGRIGDPAAIPALEAIAADPAWPAIRRGTALSLLGRYASSRITPAIAAGLDDPEPLVRIGALQAFDGGPSGTVMALATALLADRVGAVRAEAGRMIALGGGPPTDPTQADALASADAVHRRVQAVNADHASSWIALGDLDAARGRAAEAEKEYRKALALDEPAWAAHLNLADLQRAWGRDDLARETLEAALELGPDVPELLHAMGLLLVRAGEREAALSWLERAAEGAPGSGRFAYVYGIALWSQGSQADGVRVLSDALASHPFDAELLRAMVSYLDELGRADEAREYARRLVEVRPEDPEARELLGRLGGG